jgi:DNA-binding transcriptional LysR family regulator
MPTFTGSILCATLLRFAKEYKHVRVSIHEAYSANLSKQVADGLLDFAVVPAVSSGLGLDTFRMAKDRECLVCSSQNDIVRSAKKGLKGLAPLRIILPAKVNSRRPRIEQYLAVNGIEVAETIELDAMLGTLDMVANSEWVSILPGILGRADRDGVKRRFIPLSDPPLDVEYMRISHKARPLNQAAQAFLDTLQDELDIALTKG